jgi:hypothetical protein
VLTHFLNFDCFSLANDFLEYQIRRDIEPGTENAESARQY